MKFESIRNVRERERCTFVFECGDDEVKSAGLGAPSICDVFERDKVGSCGDGADALARVTTREVGLGSIQNAKSKEIIARVIDRL